MSRGHKSTQKLLGMLFKFKLSLKNSVKDKARRKDLSAMAYSFNRRMR